MNRPITIAIVDDHPVVRKGIVQTFAEEGDFTVVAEGASADDAVRIARDFKPDIMILDVTMPGGGIEAARTIRSEQSSARIVMLSIREDLVVVRTALQAGALGYVSKGVASNELVASARAVLRGERCISSALAARLIAGEGDHSHGMASQFPAEALPNLTAREKEILDLVAEGLSNLDIAERIGLSENTVKHYMTPLLHKLGVRNRTEAALLARGTGKADRV